MVVTTGRPTLNTFTVNEIDVSSYVRPSTQDDIGDNEPAAFSLSLVKNAEIVLGTMLAETMIGKAVKWTRGVTLSTEEVCFDGEVVDFKTNGRIVTLDCRDKMWRATKKVETNVYTSVDSTDGNPQLIYKDLMERASVPVDIAYLQDPGVDYTVTKFIVDTAHVKDRADRLVKDLPNWRHYYDPQVDSARLEVIKYDDTGITLTVGTDILNAPEWKNEGRKLVQTLTVRGAVQDTPADFVFSGDGVTTEFTLENEPSAIQLFISGTEQVLGVFGVTDAADYDYYVDKLLKKIIFLSAPASAANNITGTYNFYQERPVTVTNPGSIAKYSSQGSNQYPYEQVTHSLDTVDVGDARLYADGIIAEDGEVNPTTNLSVKGYFGWRRNQKVTVVDTRNGINQTVYIQSVQRRFPYDYDVIRVNRRPQSQAQATANMYNRVKRIEENITRGKKKFFVTKPSGRKVGIARRQFKKRSRTWSEAYTGWVFDSPLYSIFDTSGFDADVYSTTWYPLIEDSSEHYGGTAGTDSNITYTGTDGRFAAVFNGTSSEMTLPDGDTLITDDSAWSVSLWVYVDTHAAGAVFLQFTDIVFTSDLVIYLSGASTMDIQTRNAALGLVSGTLASPYTVQQWNHVVATYDGTTFRAYFNGVEVVSTVTTFAGFSSEVVRLGRLNGGSTWLDGAVRDFRIYDGHVVGQEEVTALYNGGEARDLDDRLWFSGYTLDWLMPAHDIHREYLTSDDGIVLERTDATVNTTTQTVTATGATKTVVFGPIHKGPTLSRLKLLLNFSGSLNSVSIANNAEGTGSESLGTFVTGNLQTVTLATPLTESYIIVSMASGAVISKPEDAYGQATGPAVKVVLDSYT